MFTAIAGQGAQRNGKKIVVSSTQNIDRAFVSVCLPYGRDARFDHAISVFDRIARQSYGVRKMGAAALDQAYLAQGYFDAVVFEGLGWWDVAAGMLLVQEAGGYVADYTHQPVGPDYHSYLATNGQKLYQKFQNLICQT